MGMAAAFMSPPGQTVSRVGTVVSDLGKWRKVAKVRLATLAALCAPTRGSRWNGGSFNHRKTLAPSPMIPAWPLPCRWAARLWRTAMLRRSLALSLAAALFACAFALAPQIAGAQDKSITVFAAASMKNALDNVNAAYTKATGIKVVSSYAASSALAKQIEGGAPADVFVSADLKWMDYLQDKKAIRTDTRVNLLGNKLVLIAPKESKIGTIAIGQGFDLAKLAGDGRIATGDVRAVPVGLYAKAALEKLGSWAAAEPKFAMTDNVRAALLLVSRGEAALGIVYETDAKVEPGVKIIGAFPEGSHPPITYPVAATATAKPDVAGYLAFLRGKAAKDIFETYGFTVLTTKPST
jgi:molybdate transport system substrate-binding protein